MNPIKIIIEIDKDFIKISDSEGRSKTLQGVFISGGDYKKGNLYFCGHGDRQEIAISIENGFKSAIHNKKAYYSKLFESIMNKLRRK